MLKLLLNSDFIKGKTCSGVFVFINPDNSYKISFCNLKKNKKSLSIQKYASGFSSLAELNKYCNAKTPVVLCLDGKGVIHKASAVSVESDKTTAIQKIFPNASASDFVVTINRISETGSLISLARNEVVNEIVSKLPEGLYVIEYILGPLGMNRVLPLLLQVNTNLECDKYNLGINNNRIAEITRNDSGKDDGEFNIGNENIPGNVIIAFSAALKYFVEDEESIGFKGQEQDSNEFFYKRIFSYSWWAALFIIFFLLLINFLVFDHYRQKQSELSSRLSLNQNMLKRIDTLKYELSVKRAFIEKNSLLFSSRQSFYADRIAASLPDNINLILIKQCPVKNKLTDEIQPEIQNDVIFIEGKSKNSVKLNEWISNLSKKDWVRQVDVTSYSQENSGSWGEFIIKITIKTG